MAKPSKTTVLIMLGAVLLMAVVIVLGGLGRVYFEEPQDIGVIQQETKQEAISQLTCSSTLMGLDIKSAEYMGRDVEVVLENQAGEIIEKVKVKLVGERGEEELIKTIGLEAFGIKTVYIIPDPRNGDIREVAIYPMIQDQPCMNKERRSDVLVKQ